MAGQERHGGTRPLRVFILDDHALTRQGLRDLLEQEGMEIVGDSNSALVAMASIPKLKPDVAVLDARLSDGTGIEVSRAIRSAGNATSCVILTAYDDERALRAAVLGGAAAFVPKQINHDLVRVIRRVAQGGLWFAPGTQERVLEEISAEAMRAPWLSLFTVQQRQVVALLGRGMTDWQIGNQLGLGEKLVRDAVSAILARLGFERRAAPAAGAPRLAPETATTADPP